MIDARKQLAAIRESYSAIDEIVAWPDEQLLKTVSDISQWSAGQQLQHIGLVNSAVGTQIVQLVSRADEPDSDRRLTMTGVAVLSSGYIPRGVGRSPSRVQPPDSVTRKDVTGALAASGHLLDELEIRADVLATRKGRFEHPHFGYLRPVQWVRFMNIHTAHHLKIVRDIERALGT